MSSSSNKLKSKVLSIFPDGDINRIISIDFPKEGLRARKVISRSNANMSGKWPSFKTSRSIHYESANERNAFKLLDASPDVISYSEQPCVIHYIINGEVHIHYPDILVNYNTHREIWEVKTEMDSKSIEVARRTELMAKFLPTYGYFYKIVIAEDLKVNPRLNNVTHLLQYGHKAVSLIEREQIRQLFKKSDVQEWGFFQLGTPGGVFHRVICRLILEGVLKVDINQPLVSSTLISYNHQVQRIKSWQ